MGVFLHRQTSLSFHARADGGLQGFVIVTVGFEHEAFRAENFRFEPRPKHLFGGHAVVGEKTTSRKRRGAQNAHPADFFGSDIRLQGKVDAHCHADRQHRADKLPGVQPEKDIFMVVADFFWYFDFYSRHLRKEKRRYAICTAAFFIIDISYNFVSRGRFCKFPRYFLIHQF